MQHFEERVVVKYLRKRSAENFDFVENINFTRGSTETVVHRGSVGKLS